MKEISLYINEKLKFTKDFKPVSNEKVETHDGLLKAIKEASNARKDPHILDLTHLDVSSITDFSYMFLDINPSSLGLDDVKEVMMDGWDVSNGRDFRGAFYCMESMVRAGISEWDVSNAVAMTEMFYGCWKFNEDISNWDVSNVRIFNDMFEECHVFNQDLSRWDVSKCTDFDKMFMNCYKFNSDVSKWKMSSAKWARSMFEGCTSLNKDLSRMDMDYEHVSIYRMFENCPNLKKLPKWYSDIF